MNAIGIKICGLSRIEDIDYVNQLKPDYAGFVFFQKSRRAVSMQQAEELVKRLDKRIIPVGVFVDEDREVIAELLRKEVIEIAQLHGNETEEDIRYLQMQTGKKVMKAIKVETAADIKRWEDTNAEFLLLDNGQGTGRPFDWCSVGKLPRPFFLAGGLNSQNVETAITQLSPFAVDVSSGVESNGKKDYEKIREFMKLVRKHGALCEERHGY